jgi:hypothetical protein
MTEGEFRAITDHPATLITVDNNPAPDFITPTPGGLGLPGLYFVLSTTEKLYIYDGAEAIYMALEKTVETVKYYTFSKCTQDITEFTDLLND